MSIIGTRHTLAPFTSGESKPLTGQRLARIGYKAGGEGKKPKFPSVCASVPPVALDAATLVAMGERLLPHIRTLLETAQDGIIRSLYESSGGTLREVSDDDISLDACIGWLEAVASGGRLSRELVESWFDRTCRDTLTVLVADKLSFDLSTPEQEETVSRHVRVYRDLLASLTGGKTLLTSVQIAACRRALEVSGVQEDDEIGSKLVSRLDALERKPSLDALLAL